jgi:UDP-2-acetamido-3-amino-2,3-dideoxy-glucuronate N-acetyltransferase
VRIGDRVKVEAFAFLPPGVVLEDDVFVGPHATFTNDRRPRAKGEWERVGTIVWRGASVGAGAMMPRGVAIVLIQGAGPDPHEEVPSVRRKTTRAHPPRRCQPID